MDFSLALKTHFGFDSFRKGQEEVVSRLMAGQSALAVFPTGSGKSLCFQLPAVLLPNLTVVVSPLIALMKDQVDFLLGKGIRAARLDSTLEWNEVQDIYDKMRANELDMLYVAPERLSNEKFANVLRLVTIDLMVVDEAHCISEWGHNFRPDYMKLSKLAQTLNVGRVLGLTATATPAVAQDICRAFSIQPDNYVHTGFYRPNLSLHFSPVLEAQKNTLLVQRLGSRVPGPTIVYVTLQKTTETVATFLKEAGYNACFYHAGMAADVRAEVQNWFMASTNGVVVATIAFGMGVDKSDIRYVYHYNLPKSLENYSQEVGRAGRDGLASVCEVLACYNDVTVLENFIYGDTPSESALSRMIDYVMAMPDVYDVSVYEMAGIFDIRTLVIGTFMTYLELMGIHEATTPFYDEYKIEFKVSAEEICAKFQVDRSDFLKQLFAAGKSGRKYLSIHIRETASALGQPVDRVVKALNYLEDQGFLSINVAGIRKGYRFKQRPTDVDALKQEMFYRFMNSEEREIERVRTVLELIDEQGCKVQALLNYFGESHPGNCGHCEWCLGGDFDMSVMESEFPEMNDADVAVVLAVKEKNYPPLAEPRQLARFLCGISSPASSRYRLEYQGASGKSSKAALTRSRFFGKLAHIPFGDLLDYLSYQ